MALKRCTLDLSKYGISHLKKNEFLLTKFFPFLIRKELKVFIFQFTIIGILMGQLSVICRLSSYLWVLKIMRRIVYHNVTHGLCISF